MSWEAAPNPKANISSRNAVGRSIITTPFVENQRGRFQSGNVGVHAVATHDIVSRIDVAATRVQHMVRRHFPSSVKMCELRIVFRRFCGHEDVGRHDVCDGNVDDNMFIPPVSSVDARETPIVFNRRPTVLRNLNQVLWSDVSAGLVKKLTYRRAGLIPINQCRGIVVQFDFGIDAAESVVFTGRGYLDGNRFGKFIAFRVRDRVPEKFRNLVGQS